MAPSFQERLQGAWDTVSASLNAQPGPFDIHFCSFLQNLVQKSSWPPQKHSGFRLHFPFPFAGLFHNRQQRKSTSEDPTHRLADSSHDDLRRQNNALVSKNGEEGLQSSRTVHILSEKERAPGGDHLRSHGNAMTELQLLQMQLETSGLGLSAPASKEVLGRATWTFLHTLAAQFPEKPTRQQQRDAKELMAILSRLYPCKECADHFKEVLKASPVQAGSGVELAQWMCTVHNVVNRSLGKPLFPCQRVDARWGAMDCDEGACDLQGRMH